eukprot:258178-Pelagomonas_calceolata.AAC.5
MGRLAVFANDVHGACGVKLGKVADPGRGMETAFFVEGRSTKCSVPEGNSVATPLSLCFLVKCQAWEP